LPQPPHAARQPVRQPRRIALNTGILSHPGESPPERHSAEQQCKIWLHRLASASARKKENRSSINRDQQISEGPAPTSLQTATKKEKKGIGRRIDKDTNNSPVL